MNSQMRSNLKRGPLLSRRSRHKPWLVFWLLTSGCLHIEAWQVRGGPSGIRTLDRRISNPSVSDGDK